MKIGGGTYLYEGKNWKEKDFLSYMGGKGMFEILNVEESKGYKKKNLRQNNNQKWTNID